jgi:hypothetical protein
MVFVIDGDKAHTPIRFPTASLDHGRRGDAKISHEGSAL